MNHLHFWKRLRQLALLWCWLFQTVRVSAQPTTLPLHSAGEQIVERLSILNSDGPVHPELKPYTRQDAVNLALQVAAGDSLAKSAVLWQHLQYLFDDNTEWLNGANSARGRTNRKPLFGAFYRTPANFFEVNVPAFHLRVNPLFNFLAGQESGDAEFIFANQRGLEVRGDVDGRVFFSTNILETQVRYPDYINRWTSDYQAVPGAGFFKTYQSKLFNIRNGYDFNLASASIGGNITRHIGVQFGHGQHFIGNGYRSLLLSDVGNNTFFLKISTRIWKLHYQNLFLELSPISTAVPRPPNSILPKKYAAIHYLSFRLKPNLAFGFFEATVFNRSRQFEFQYLNPIILYRTVEGMIGSPDNVLIGFDGHWNFLHRFQLYGQLMVDEFLFDALYKPDQKGWWGNKFGWQAGLKYVDAFGVDQLDLQLEYNSVRPYTYSSFDSLNSYTHYNQPLAHPLWSNFREIIGIARYQPHPRLTLSGRLIYGKTGDNTATENWGANPLLSNAVRVQDYGNDIGQGVGATIFLAGLDASWALYHNIFVDLRLLLRQKNSRDDSLDLETQMAGLGLRMNLWNRNFDF